MDNVVGSFFSNGRKHTVREVTVNCGRCFTDFKCQMTTKPAKHCIECVVIMNKEKYKRDHERRKKKEQREAETPPVKKKRKIPYAGFDPTERHYD